MVTSFETIAIVVSTIAALAAGLFSAYQAGYLDPVVEWLGVYFFKAKAKAEKKKLQAQGLKVGEDFAEGELPGNQQADQVKDGVGALGGQVGEGVSGGLGGLTKGL